ncbi:penicillin-binding protein [Betaproteobacteria bacterium]|nr:penicillin-binding protein [Betaproteobacteria bacterium]
MEAGWKDEFFFGIFQPLGTSTMTYRKPRHIWMALLFAGLLACSNSVIKDPATEESRSRDLEISASRGRIFDRNGEVLAVSTPMRSIWYQPGGHGPQPTLEQTRRLAELLEMEVKELEPRLASDKFVYLKRRLPPETGDKVAALKIPGIGQDREYRRYYPIGETTAHVVGFTDIDDKGLEGVEFAFQGQLPGHPGRDIHLALDSKIQHIAYSQLKQAVKNFKAQTGSVVVADARTGEILALANWPGYNPNNREYLKGEQLRNRAVTDTYEPGSVMSPFTAALALETGKVRFDTVINTAPGRLTIGNATISDSHSHGPLTVTQVIQKSSNVGMAKIAALLTPEKTWQMYKAIGLRQAPGLGFPGEASGRLQPWKSWRPIEQATLSYGQGLSVSLMQLARAYTVFAREGDIIPLTLTRSDGTPVRASPVFSQQTVREMRAMLEIATQPGGTAPKARVPGYRTGGKSSTAYKIKGGQYVKKYVASFVGFAPVSDPRLIVAVMIDEPSSGEHYGGDVAGPVFSQVMGGALHTLGIVPDASADAGSPHRLE